MQTQHDVAPSWSNDTVLTKLRHLVVIKYNYMLEDNLLHKLRAGIVTCVDCMLHNNCYLIVCKTILVSGFSAIHFGL